MLVRFDGIERAAHWLTALLFTVLVVTGAALYIPAIVGLVGRRVLVLRVHVDAGLALPVPLVVSMLGRWGRGLRADLRRLNRWTAADRQWLGLVARRLPVSRLPTGKFNAGQKLNAAFVGGVIVVMLMTGCIMRWANLWPLSWRTGATFVHDVVAYCFVFVILGHIVMAVTHPAALRSMLSGKVTRAWAQRHSPSWVEELDGSEASRGGVDAPR